jgi:chemotaxis-related protein WspD
MPEQANTIDPCWNRIGVWGNEQPRCPRLDEVVHCQNCNVYSDSGRQLLERKMPPEYIEEWTSNLGGDAQAALRAEESSIVFRLGNEWFALATALLKEVTEMRSVHSIPHARNGTLKGLANIRGELQLCVSLGSLLGLETGDKNTDPARKIRERLVVIEKDGERFVFPVNEVQGIHHYHPDQINDAPATIGSADNTFITGMLEIGDLQVGCLDGDLLVHALQRKVH